MTRISRAGTVIACALALASCGDNAGPCTLRGVAPVAIPCSTRECTDVHVVAHEDDDLLFMTPDIAGELAGGHRVVVVYVTAGELDAPAEESYWRARERGMLGAYTFLAEGGPIAVRDDARWTATVDQLAGLTFQTYRAGSVSLVFLRLGDLQTQCLWEDANGCSTIDPHPTAPPYLAATKACTTCVPSQPAQHVSRDQLIEVLAQLMTREGATSVATLDSTALHFDALGPASDGFHEYWDHYFVALFATAAAARAHVPLLASYRGYTVSHTAANLDEDQACTKLDAFAHYAIYDSAVVRHKARFLACPSCYWQDAYGVLSADSWQRRELATRTLVPAGSFALRSGDTCLTTALALGDCRDALVVTAAGDRLKTAGGCLEVVTTGGHVDVPAPDCGGTPCTPVPPIDPPESLRIGACDTEGSSFHLLDNGQVRTANARCLTAAAGAASSSDCRALVAHGHVTDRADPTQAWVIDLRP